MLRGLLIAATAWLGSLPARPVPSDTDPALVALASLPWTTDTTGLGAICPEGSGCDSVVVEPRVLSATQPVLFLVPGRMATLRTLVTIEPRLGKAAAVLGSRDDCVRRRDHQDWPDSRVACAVLAIVATDDASQGQTVVINVLTPRHGWCYLQVQLARNAAGIWKAVLKSYWYE